MPYVTPTIKVTGDLVTAADWNQNTVTNVIDHDHSALGGGAHVPLLVGSHGQGGVIGAGTTYYQGLFQAGQLTTEADAATSVAVPGTVRKLYVRTGSSQPATGTLVFTVRKNGSDTSVTATVAAGAGAGVVSDLAHTAVFAAGDYLVTKIVNNAAIVSAQIAGLSLEYS